MLYVIEAALITTTQLRCGAKTISLVPKGTNGASVGLRPRQATLFVSALLIGADELISVHNLDLA